MNTIIRGMSQDGRDFIFDFLRSTVNGNCYHFALAMHRGLGWPLVGLIDEGEIIHVGVKSPEGKIWDGRGELSEKEFGEIFMQSPFIIREIKEKDLLKTGTVKEYLVEIILKRAQLVWAELPWKNGTIQERIYKFVQELVELSQRHGLWIVGNTPTSLPIILEGFSDERGYEIMPTDDGNGFIISRMLN